jgi:protein SCO1/2
LIAVPVRVRLAILLAASFAVAAAFFATLGQGEERSPAAGDRFVGAIRPPGMPPVSFRMTDQNGKVVTGEDLRGTVSVITFLYTTCEDTCPLVAQQIRMALDDLGHDVPVYAVSVDPPRDTPERAKRFLAEHRVAGRMDFLLGPTSELRRQWKAFGIQRQTESLDHSAHVVVLDRQGRQRVGFPADALVPEDLAHDIALLEREA